MKKILLLIIIFGMLFWVYLLLGGNIKQETPATGTDSETSEIKVETKTQSKVRFEAPEDAPPQTDAGMEFPTTDK